MDLTSLYGGQAISEPYHSCHKDIKLLEVQHPMEWSLFGWTTIDASASSERRLTKITESCFLEVSKGTFSPKSV